MISVIIPTYNRKHVVVRAIESVLAQDYKNFELIVVDDGSDDGSYEYLTALFPQTNIIQQENRGVSSARNLGVSKAQGEWIAFLDSDDEWLPHKLSTQIRYLDNAKEKYYVCHSAEIWFRDGVRVNPMKKHVNSDSDLFAASLKLCIISTSSALIHRSVFENIGRYDETFPACEDYDLWLRITAKYKVLFLKETLVNKYGGKADQLSKKYWGMDRFRINAMDKLLQSNILDKAQNVIARAELKRKLSIFLKGALKHNNIKDYQIYKNIYDQYFCSKNTQIKATL